MKENVSYPSTPFYFAKLTAKLFETTLTDSRIRSVQTQDKPCLSMPVLPACLAVPRQYL